MKAWMGGAKRRTKVKIQSKESKQREFFEKQRRKAVGKYDKKEQNSKEHGSSARHISLDLLRCNYNRRNSREGRKKVDKEFEDFRTEHQFDKPSCII